jgi:hypothetical protein
MADLQVTCASKIAPGTSDQHIYWLAGPGGSKPQSEVISDIKYGINTHYTLVGSR